MTQLDVYGLTGETRPAVFDPAAERVRILVGAWLLSKKNPNTRKAYRRDVMAWIDWAEENDVDPLNVRRIHIDAWSESGAGLRDNPANTTLARRLSAVSSFYRYLLWEDVVEKTPCAHIERPKVNRDHSDTRGLTKHEARDMLVGAAAHSRRAKVIVTLGLFDGLRCDELIMLDVEDLASDSGHRTLDLLRKGGYKQRVPVGPAAVASVEDYIDGRVLEPDRARHPLLVTSSGARLTPDRVFRIVRQCAELAGIERPHEVTPHSLRHTFITLSLDAGVALRDVQDAAGHADPRTTRRYDKNRNSLERHPTYQLAAHLAT
jgi:integrase/recombinase XerD